MEGWGGRCSYGGGVVEIINRWGRWEVFIVCFDGFLPVGE